MLTNYGAIGMGKMGGAGSLGNIGSLGGIGKSGILGKLGIIMLLGRLGLHGVWATGAFFLLILIVIAGFFYSMYRYRMRNI